MNLFSPKMPLTDQEILEEARKIANNYEQSGFATDETLVGWIVGAMKEAAKRAKDAEHDRIEVFIGTQKATAVRRMIHICKLKWGK